MTSGSSESSEEKIIRLLNKQLEYVKKDNKIECPGHGTTNSEMVCPKCHEYNILDGELERLSICKQGHQFKPIRSGYYKESGERIHFSEGGKGLPAYDHSVEYRTLYCPKCGIVKEVVSANHKEV